MLCLTPLSYTVTRKNELQIYHKSVHRALFFGWPCIASSKYRASRKYEKSYHSLYKEATFTTPQTIQCLLFLMQLVFFSAKPAYYLHGNAQQPYSHLPTHISTYYSSIISDSRFMLLVVSLPLARTMFIFRDYAQSVSKWSIWRKLYNLSGRIYLIIAHNNSVFTQEHN